MIKRLIAAAALALCAASASAQAPASVNAAAILAERPPLTLAEYRFFRDAGAREPNARVTPYDLNTALYSDGALKFRYVYIPQGQTARYDAEGVFEFPVGTVLIKTFAFAADMRSPGENVRFLETRLLIRRSEGWIALPYVWNEAQTEARLSPIGADIPVSFTGEYGAAVAFDWAVPNRNQCKGCHDSAGELVPIGPSARNLNRLTPDDPFAPRESDIDAHVYPINQIYNWTLLGLLSGGPELPSSIERARPTEPYVPSAYNSEDGTLEQRARAYLDVNCAHCHNPEGPAHTSGLDLRWSQHEPVQWGVLKRPVAAGRGSAGYDFAIEPGHPERSILLYRMESTDPGVMMPELGRQRIDARGVALIREWIAEMDAQGSAE